MSRTPEDVPPIRKPPGGEGKPRKPRPAPVPETDPDEPSTFRPNPKRTAPTAGSGDIPASEGPNTFQKSGARRGSKGDAGVKDVNPGKGPTLWERIFFGRVGSGQLALFCRQFGAYQNAGVDISKTLTNLQRQFSMTALGPVIGRMQTGVKRGDTLTETVEREPQAFDALFVGMIRVAEARGGVPETLKLLSRHYENRQSLIRQARSAMIYPIIVMMLASAVVALMTIFILPLFASLLKEIAGRSASLPLPSRILLAFSDFTQKAGWLLFPVVLIGTPILVFRFYKTQGGKALMDRGLLWVPVFGSLARKIDMSRFSRTLSALLNAGVDVGSSLELTADVMHLDPYKKAVRDVKAQVIQGSELSEALDSTGRFTSDVIAVVNSGEESGSLPEALDKVADDYEEQVAHMVKNMGQLVQPLLMIMMGGLVLFIILAVFLPYISIITNLSR